MRRIMMKKKKNKNKKNTPTETQPHLQECLNNAFMFCWGKNSDGQLGLAGIHDKSVTRPLLVNKNNLPLWLSCGWRHTAFLARDGTIKTCGSNEYGQLGKERGGRHPEVVTALETHTISQVVCGQNHTAAVSDQGLVFTWGDNSKGQLGLGLNAGQIMCRPKIIKQLAKMMIVQLACGANHCIAMSRGGHLFSWGQNSNGQLGVGIPGDQYEPSPVSSLRGVPFALINAGGAHTFALTTSGALFGWGKNDYGQLGVHDLQDRNMPTLLRSLRSQHVIYVACGENHTAVLTVDGGVFTFGCGSSGQLGHNSDNHEHTPKKVFDLMGSVVSQIACGRSYTLALVPSLNKVYSFGQGESGQLGIDSTASSNSCAAVKGPWSPHKDTSTLETHYQVFRVVAGGDHSFVMAVELTDGVDSPDDRYSNVPVESLLTLSESFTCDLVKQASLESNTRDIFEILETIFSSQASLSGSFLDSGLLEGISSRVHGIDLIALRKSFQRLGAIPSDHLKSLIISSIADHLIPSMQQQQPPDIEALRVYLILPELELISTKHCYNNIVIPFAKTIMRLKAEALRVLSRWWSTLPSTYFSNAMKLFKDCVRFLLSLSPQATIDEVNNDVREIVQFKQFYVPEIQQNVDIRADYFNWIQNEVTTDTTSSGLWKMLEDWNMFSFCRFPFVFDASAKTKLLQADAVMQMQCAVDEVHRHNVQSMMSFSPTNPIHPCLIILVHRENIVQDTLTQITKTSAVDLKKPLKVIFVNEEAVDAGGVRKEFFLLLLTEVLDPKYGMFTYFEESHTIWFNDQTFEECPMFRLIGVICGLAIYNSTIIDLKFPPVLYKKLLHRPPTLEDFRTFQPSVARNLQSLLDYPGDEVEDTFELNFQIIREKYGAIEKIDLIPDGERVSVTADNRWVSQVLLTALGTIRQHYVNAYMDYYLNKSVQKQFQAFSNGFHRVCGGRVLEFFHPQELMEMVIGCQEYDFKVLEKVAEYKGVYYHNHPVIRNFWDVFHEFPIDMKKKFLAFLTGSDRVPILGMESLKIIIQPVAGGEHGDHLPVAHTCFNLLDLPRYPTKEIMKTKLSQAVQYSTGFGLA
ncbi:hypothetical protein QZH41_015897 [Actinostola sp. cb2023]|nr:hypothetical protein QZH41_015897 [Actinostola sp. cb2023]